MIHKFQKGWYSMLCSNGGGKYLCPGVKPRCLGVVFICPRVKLHVKSGSVDQKRTKPVSTQRQIGVRSSTIALRI